VRKIVVHDEDKAPMCITGGWLADGMKMEADVVPFPEMLIRDYARSSALGHAGRMSGTDVKLTRVAIMVGEVELNYPIPMNVNVDAFDVDGSAKPVVASSDKGKTVGFQASVSTHVDEVRSALGLMRRC
jgi:hypothetical protein